MTWDEALTELVTQLDAVAARDARALAFVTRAGASQRHDLVAQFLDRFGAPRPIPFELFGDEVLRRANLLSFGREQLPTFDLAHSRYVIAFGADFLGTWNSPVAQSAAYGRMRQGRPGMRGKFVQVEPRMSQTGANADEWVPARPGTEGVLALGLAHVISARSLRTPDAAGRAGALIDGWSSGLSAYTPADVERRTGVAAARIERLARELADQRPAVAIIGGAPLAQTNGLFHGARRQRAERAARQRRRAGRPQSFTPQTARRRPRRARGADGPRAPSARSRPTSSPADRSPVQVLLVDGANPVFAAPAAWRVRDALLKVPFIASFGSFIDDTSVLADLILPDHSFLESWTDGRPESGASVAVATLAPPAMRPLHQTRATPDVLLDVGRRLKRPIALPWQTFDEMLMASFAALRPSPAGGRRRVGARAASRADGGAMPPKAPGRPAVAPGGPVGRRSPAARASCRPTQFDGDAGQYPVSFPALRVAGVPRRLARAPAVAAGAARRHLDGDVEQLGGDQSADGRAPGDRRGRRRGDRVGARNAARAGARVAGHRARRDRDAGRPGTRDVHAVRERPRREPDRDSRAGRPSRKPARWRGRRRACGSRASDAATAS